LISLRTVARTSSAGETAGDAFCPTASVAEIAKSQAPVTRRCNFKHRIKIPLARPTVRLERRKGTFCCINDLSVFVEVMLKGGVAYCVHSSIVYPAHIVSARVPSSSTAARARITAPSVGGRSIPA
jgi:hypothetical protein